MTHTLKQHARSLRLSGLLDSLELRLQEAESNRLPYAQFLELVFQDEINVREQRHHRPAQQVGQLPRSTLPGKLRLQLQSRRQPWSDL